MAGQLKEIRDLPSANDITSGGGDFMHIKQGDVDRKIRVIDLFKFHTTNQNNPHNVTKAQVGLDQVTNDLQLKAASNLFDLPDKGASRNNLGVYSKTESDTNLNAHTSRTDNPHVTTKAQVGLGNVVNGLQLQAANNLSDLPDKVISRNNLDVYSKSESNNNLAAHTNRVDNPHSTTKAQVGLGNVANFGYTTDYNNNSQTLYSTISAVNDVYNIVVGQFVRAARGMIIMWHGDPSAIPAGWALCNGANGTPNLLDRFIVGAGSGYGWGATGGANTTYHGHSGGVGGTVLGWNHIPPHQHASGWGEHLNRGSAPYGTNPLKGLTNNEGSQSTDYDNPEFLTSSTLFLGGAVRNAADPHGHALSIDGASLENRPPYYALFYIMKL